MSISKELITQLQTLIKNDPVLAQQMEASPDIQSGVKTLASAAAAKRIPVDASELSAYLQQALISGKASTITEEELETVAGGGDRFDEIAAHLENLGWAPQKIADSIGMLRLDNRCRITNAV